MKIIIVLACVFALAVAQEEKDRKKGNGLRKIRQECAKQAEIDNESIKKVMETSAFNDEKFQKFTKCFMQEINCLAADGSINWDAAREKCNAYTKDCAFIDECQAKTGSSIAETTASAVSCIFVNIHKQVQEKKLNQKDDCGEGGCPA